jgi:glycosyltransferase involved in cell wall biosynthesis
MNIVYVFADKPVEWNSSEWRCAIPARAINRTKRHQANLLSIDDFAVNSSTAQAVCDPADVIVVQRNLFGRVLSAIQHWKARDKVMIADFDDAYHLMPPSNVSYPFWGKGLRLKAGSPAEVIDPSPLTQFRWGLRLVHAATVPSKRLADDWQAYTRIHYVPNYIDLKQYENVIAGAHAGVMIGWGGSLSHFESFKGSGVIEALRGICRARSHVKVMICGNDRRIYDLLPVAASQKIYQPAVPFEQWPGVLSSFDIGIAPLYGEYDERRSWIKPLEYMVMRIPWVGSDGPAYHELRDYGWLVNNTPEAWERVLSDLVDNLASYKAEAACEPYLFGLSQSVDENVNEILGTYASIANLAFRELCLKA